LGQSFLLLPSSLLSSFLPESLKFDKKNAIEVEMEKITVTNAPLLQEKEKENGIKEAEEKSEEIFDEGALESKKSFSDRIFAIFGKNKYHHLGKKLSKEGVDVNKKPGISIVFKTRSVLITIILVCVQSTVVVSIDDLFPLWARNPPPGGLGFSSAQIGLCWSIGGISMMFYQGFCYTRIINWIGRIRGVRYGSFGFAVLFMLYPLLSKLIHTSWIWVGVGAALTARYVFGSTTGTTLNIVLNTVGGREVQRHRGVVNGFAMSCRGALLAVSPFIASSIFAWSNSAGHSFPLNYYLEFELLAFACIFVSVGSIFISNEEEK